jgi:plastocyanin domain-containing protein
MSKFRSILVAATLTMAPAAAFVVPVTAAAQEAGAKQEAGEVREIEVVVDNGYTPNRIEVNEGERVRLKFIRREYTPCTREVRIPSLNIRQELPPNKPVVVDLPPLKAGEVEYRCGMNMARGTLVVNPRKS